MEVRIAIITDMRLRARTLVATLERTNRSSGLTVVTSRHVSESVHSRHIFTDSLEEALGCLQVKLILRESGSHSSLRDIRHDALDSCEGVLVLCLFV